MAKYPLPLVALSLLTPAVGAAPRPAPKPEFVSHDGAGGSVLTRYEFVPEPGSPRPGGTRELADTELIVNFAVRGPAGAAYTVELWVEAYNTGEKAQFLEAQTVTLGGPKGSDVGRATGKFDRRVADGYTGRRKKTDPQLPSTYPGAGWSYRLVLKKGKEVVSDTGSHFADSQLKPHK